MSEPARGFPLRHKHVIDVSGAVAGQPVFPLHELTRVLHEEVPELSTATCDPESPVGRCAGCLKEQLEGINTPNAHISFLRQERDIWVLSIRPEHSGTAEAPAFTARLAILEPLAVARSNRTIVTATVACRADPLGTGMLYSASVPVFDADREVMYASYDGLLLMDKLLSRLATSPVTPSDIAP